MSDRNYTVQTKINCPVAKVFEAIVSDKQIGSYFTDRTSGPIVEGHTVTWSWEEWGDFPVVVKKVTAGKLIELELDSQKWGKTPDQSYPVTIRLEFEELTNDSTMLSISESGWLTDEPGLKGSHDNCSGWTHMAMCLKAFLEHGINLRS